MGSGHFRAPEASDVELVQGRERLPLLELEAGISVSTDVPGKRPLAIQAVLWQDRLNGVKAVMADHSSCWDTFQELPPVLWSFAIFTLNVVAALAFWHAKLSLGRYLAYFAFGMLLAMLPLKLGLLRDWWATDAMGRLDLSMCQGCLLKLLMLAGCLTDPSLVIVGLLVIQHGLIQSIKVASTPAQPPGNDGAAPEDVVVTRGDDAALAEDARLMPDGDAEAVAADAAKMAEQVVQITSVIQELKPRVLAFQIKQALPQLAVQATGVAIQAFTGAEVSIAAVAAMVVTMVIGLLEVTANHAAHTMQISASPQTIKHAATVSGAAVRLNPLAVLRFQTVVILVFQMLGPVATMVCLFFCGPVLVTIPVIQVELSLRLVTCALLALLIGGSFVSSCFMLLHSRNDRLWHVVLSPRAFASVMLASAFIHHELLLTAAADVWRSTKGKEEEKARLQQLLSFAAAAKSAILAALMAWGVWKSDFPVRERILIPLLVLDGLCACVTLLFSPSPPLTVESDQVSIFVTAQEVEDYELCTQLEARLPSLSVDEACAQAEKINVEIDGDSGLKKHVKHLGTAFELKAKLENANSKQDWRQLAQFVKGLNGPVKEWRMVADAEKEIEEMKLKFQDIMSQRKAAAEAEAKATEAAARAEREAQRAALPKATLQARMAGKLAKGLSCCSAGSSPVREPQVREKQVPKDQAENREPKGPTGTKYIKALESMQHEHEGACMECLIGGLWTGIAISEVSWLECLEEAPYLKFSVRGQQLGLDQIRPRLQQWEKIEYFDRAKWVPGYIATISSKGEMTLTLDERGEAPAKPVVQAGSTSIRRLLRPGTHIRVPRVLKKGPAHANSFLWAEGLVSEEEAGTGGETSVSEVQVEMNGSKEKRVFPHNMVQVCYPDLSEVRKGGLWGELPLEPAGCCGFDCPLLREHRASIEVGKESLSGSLCLWDFVTDIATAKSFAHNSKRQIQILGYSAAGLLGCTVPVNYLILKQFLSSSEMQTLKPKIMADPQMEKIFVIYTVLALSNSEILVGALALLHPKLGPADQMECEKAMRKLKSLALGSQVVEDVPQLAAQVTGLVIQAFMGLPLSHAAIISVSSTLAMLTIKAVTNAIPLALNIDISDQTLQRASAIGQRKIKFNPLEVIDEVLQPFEVIIIGLQGMAMIGGCLFTAFCGPALVALGHEVQVSGQLAAAILCFVTYLITVTISIVMLRNDECRKRLWHVLKSVTAFAAIVVASAIHPDLLKLASGFVWTGVLQYRAVLILLVLARNAAFGALAVNGLLSRDYPISKGWCLAMLCLQGAAVLSSIIGSFDSTCTQAVEEETKITLGDVEAYEKCLNLQMDLPNLTAVKLWDQVEQLTSLPEITEQWLGERVEHLTFALELHQARTDPHKAARMVKTAKKPRKDFRIFQEVVQELSQQLSAKPFTPELLEEMLDLDLDQGFVKARGKTDSASLKTVIAGLEKEGISQLLKDTYGELAGPLLKKLYKELADGLQDNLNCTHAQVDVSLLNAMKQLPGDTEAFEMISMISELRDATRREDLEAAQSKLDALMTSWPSSSTLSWLRQLQKRQQLGRQLTTLKAHSGSVLALTTHNNHLFSGSSDKTIVVWDISSPNTPTQVTTLKAHSDPVLALTTHNNHLFSGSSDDTIVVWDISSPNTPTQVTTLKAHSNWVTALTTHNNHLFSGSEDDTIVVWDISSPNTPTQVTTLKAHSAAVTALTTHNNHLFSGSLDKTIVVWDISSPNTPTQVTTLKAHSGSVNALTTHNNHLFSGSGNETIVVWDISSPNTPTQVTTVKAHSGSVNALTTHNNHLFSGSEDNIIVVWDISLI